MKTGLSVCIAAMTLFCVARPVRAAITVTTQEEWVQVNGQRFFPLGVYFAQHRSHSLTQGSVYDTRRDPAYPYPRWNELQDNHFNTMVLSEVDNWLVGLGAWNLISGDDATFPWLTNQVNTWPYVTTEPGVTGYHNPDNAQTIFQAAAQYGFYVLTDHTPFMPDYTLMLNGVQKRPSYGPYVTGNVFRQSLVNNLVSGWPAYGVQNDQFLGWYSLDEPIWSWGPYEGSSRVGYDHNAILPRYNDVLQPMYAYVKSQDPHHIVWMNFSAPSGSAFLPAPPTPSGPLSYNAQGQPIVNGVNVQETYIQDLQLYSGATDVISADVYPIYVYNRGVEGERYRVFENGNLSVVGDYVQLLRNRKVLWILLISSLLGVGQDI